MTPQQIDDEHKIPQTEKIEAFTNLHSRYKLINIESRVFSTKSSTDLLEKKATQNDTKRNSSSCNKIHIFNK